MYKDKVDVLLFFSFYLTPADEFHHSVANGYQKTLNHFKPEFMLGLTATPYRLDQKDVLENCDYNVVYEADLTMGIHRGWLVPFYYYGIYDYTVDYNNVRYISGKYVEEDLNKSYNIANRGDLILKSYRKYRKKRALAFCATIAHAEYMAEVFCAAGFPSVSVHSQGAQSPYRMDRSEAISKLTTGEIEIICVVDMFNEGVDIPEIDTLLFLRATESPTVFFQQLGRGLRRAPGKSHVKVLDFIGNYKNVEKIPRWLSRRNRKYTPANDDDLSNGDMYPEGCYIEFDFEIVDIIQKITRSKMKVSELILQKFRECEQSIGRIPNRMELFNSLSEEEYSWIKRNVKFNPFRDYNRFLAENVGSEAARSFLNEESVCLIQMIETTSMARLYKLPIFLAFIEDGRLIKSLTNQKIIETFREFYQNPQNALDIRDLKKSKQIDEWTDQEILKNAYSNPIHFLCKTHGDLFELDAEGFITLKIDLSRFNENEKLLPDYLDAIHYRRSDFLNSRLLKDGDIDA